MSLPLFSLWNSVPARSVPGKRRQYKNVLGATSETLELRRMLSAASCDCSDTAAEVSEVAKQGLTPKQAKKDKGIPDMTGTWDLTTHLDTGGTVHTVLILTPKGKKVTGTLQNDGQPPGKLKLKIGKVVADPTAKDANDPHKVSGDVIDFLLDSPPHTVDMDGVVMGAAVFNGFFQSKIGQQLGFEGHKVP